MYKVTVDGITIHNPALDDPTVLIMDSSVKKQANAADVFTFTIYPNNRGAGNIEILTSDVEVYQDNMLLFKGRPNNAADGWENQKTYTCESGFAFFNDSILRPYEYQGSVRAYLQMLVTAHNNEMPADKQFTLRTVTVTDPNDNIVRSNSNYVTVMQEMQDKLIGNLGGYMIASYSGGRWYLDYLADSPNSTGQKITLGKNILDFAREQNAENIATALIPLGAKLENSDDRVTIESVNDDKDFIVDESAASQYGLIFTTETWDDVTLPENLLTKARARMSDLTRLIPTINLTAIDLSVTDESIDGIGILDYVTVEDDAHTASGRYLVSERTYNLDDPAKDQVTFGGEQQTISRAASRTASEVETMPARILKNASENARAILDNSTDGNIYFRYNEAGKVYEIDFLNSESLETATQMWRWNIGGWGYSGDGGETYTVAATMDGAIVASMITTGILKSDDGTTFYLDLDNGVLKGNFSELKISGAAAATQSYATSAASSAVSAYDSNLNQQAVFNKLTNNGVEQGIYLQNNKVYINGEYIKANSVTAEKISVSDLQAFGATIGAFSIDTNSIYSGTKDSGTASGDVTLRGSGTFTRSIGGTSRGSLKFAIGSKFGVAQDGTVYASALTLTGGSITLGSAFSVTSNGVVTATSGTIGGWTIDSDSISSHKTVSGNSYSITLLSPSAAYTAVDQSVFWCWVPSKVGSGTVEGFKLCLDGTAYFGAGVAKFDENGLLMTVPANTSRGYVKVTNQAGTIYSEQRNGAFVVSGNTGIGTMSYAGTEFTNSSGSTSYSKYLNSGIVLKYGGGTLNINPPTNASHSITITPTVVNEW